MSRVILVLMATLLVAQTPTCEAFIFDFMGNVLNLKGFLDIGLDLIKSIQPGTEKVEIKDHEIELLQQISDNINDMNDNLKGNFTAIFGKIDELPNAIVAANIKVSFENVINRIGKTFKRLVSDQIKTNKNDSWISNSEATVKGNEQTNLQSDWISFSFNLEKILDYLRKEESNDVCKTGISHFQLLERSLNQYMTVANQFWISRHIIYNIREYLDKNNKNVDRAQFHYDLQEDLNKDVGTFKKMMKKSSREYWLCDPAQSEDITNFMPAIKKEREVNPSDCEAIQKDGYQCIPSNNNRNCDCIKSTMVISTNLAQTDPDYVIIGAQMKIDGNVLYMAANQAKLLPNGEIDKETIKPVTKGKPGKYVNFTIRKSKMELGQLEIPQGRFMTAVGFQYSMKFDSFYIVAESMKYNFERKLFITSDVRKDVLKDNIWKTIKFARAINSEGGKQNFGWTDRIYPLIDSRMVQSSAPEPLSGLSLFLRGESEQKGFVAIKINTYNHVPLIPEIPSLNELPIQEMLKSLSNSTALHDLETKFGSL